MTYRVFLPTAGIGSRLGKKTEYLNKSLVSLNNRPVISYIIDKFPDEVEFIVALGYKGDLVRQYLELAYPLKNFIFVNIDPFIGKGSGLGLTLLQSKQYLQEPFIFISCDTLVIESIPSPSSNWIAYASNKVNNSYRTLKIENSLVSEIFDKGSFTSSNHFPYIGLSGIYNYELFWNGMDAASENVNESGEYLGLKSLIKDKILSHKMTWFDTGNLASLNQAEEYFKDTSGPVILEKEREAIWFIDSRVIKFSDDERFIKDRVLRSKILIPFVPEISSYSSNMYSYQKVEGDVLSRIVNVPIFSELLNHAKSFWSVYDLSSLEMEKFKNRCIKFYKDKTLKRVNDFYLNFSYEDNEKPINGVKMPKLKFLLEKVDWVSLSNGLPGRFHGDFHFENIILNKDNLKFTFLDWRQNFSNDNSVGDIYYDLAKLLHGIIVSHPIINDNLFSVKEDSHEINFELNRYHSLVLCEEFFYKWLNKNGYDTKRVLLITSLIYLNIASLHHEPYNRLLYLLGKYMLQDILST